MNRRKSVVTIDWILLSVFLSIVLIGWLMLYASSYEGPGWWFDINSSIGRQTIWLGVSALVFIALINVDWRIFNSLAYPIYAVCLALLVAVLLFGKEIKGASSWFSVMGFSVQPSEFAKIGTALAVAAYLGKAKMKMEGLRNISSAFAIFLLPAFLIFLQPDAGTAMVFLAFLIPLYRVGLNASLYVIAISLAFILIGSLMWNTSIMLLIILLASYFFIIMNLDNKRNLFALLLLLGLFSLASYQFINYGLLVIILILAGAYFYFLLFRKAKYREMILSIGLVVASILMSFGTQWGFDNILKPHQQARIDAWLKPKASGKGELYNIIQSKTAIGSGGFSGKGFLEGTMTKLNYVPEQNTDFVFSILGEEQGFIGSVSLIVLFTVLLFRISIIAERAAFPFIRYYAYGLAGIFFLHFFINVGMTMGLVPVIGIPLPLISKGGSSLLSFTIMIALLLKMDMARSRH